MNVFKGAIFDLDGTLLDSMHMWFEIDRLFLEKRGFAVPDDYAQALHVMNLAQAADYTVRRFQLPETPDAVLDEWMAMARTAHETSIHAKAGARDYLACLHACGVPIALATASDEALFLPALERNGLLPYFSALVSTTDVGAGKDSPAVYLEAARRIGLAPDACLAFEDTLSGVQCARAAGMQVIGVLDPTSGRDRTQIEALTLRTIHDFTQLLAPAPTLFA